MMVSVASYRSQPDETPMLSYLVKRPGLRVLRHCVSESRAWGLKRFGAVGSGLVVLGPLRV